MLGRPSGAVSERIASRATGVQAGRLPGVHGFHSPQWSSELICWLPASLSNISGDFRFAGQVCCMTAALGAAEVVSSEKTV